MPEEAMSTLSKLCLAASVALLSSCATTPSEYHMVATRSMPADIVDSNAAWALLDPDNDGSLTLAEIGDQRAIGLLQDLPNADSNQDGLVSKAEWDAWWPRMTDHYARENSAPMPLSDMMH
jgi:hypothetical protein